MHRLVCGWIWARPDHHVGEYPGGAKIYCTPRICIGASEFFIQPWGYVIGAVVGLVASRPALRGLLECFAGMFLVGGIALSVQMLRGGAEAEVADAAALATEPQTGLGARVYLYFAGLLVLYGGLETCLSGWLTTYALRYGDRTLAISEYTTLLLWMSLTVGRAGASAAMLRVGEKTVQRWGLALAAIFTAGLAVAHSAVTIAVFAILLGLSLAPFFPATWALLMAERPTARQAGIVLAVSGLGCGRVAVDDGRGVNTGRLVAGGTGTAVCRGCGTACNELVDASTFCCGGLIFQ